MPREVTLKVNDSKTKNRFRVRIKDSDHNDSLIAAGMLPLPNVFDLTEGRG